MRTPWGQSDGQRTIIKGMVDYNTPRHGGIHLAPELVKRLPKFVTTDCNHLHSLTWWEEDCDWAIPFIVFAKEIQATYPAYAEDIKIAHRVCKNWHPEIYAQLVQSVTPVTPAIDETELILANRDF